MTLEFAPGTLLPAKHSSEEDAKKAAQEMSLKSSYFFYVIYNNTGNYIVDIMGFVHSDEKLIETYYKGNVA